VFPASTAVAWLSQGKITAGNASSLNQNDGNLLTMSSIAVRGVGQVASLGATYQTTLKPTTSAYIGINGLANAPTSSSYFLYLWNYNKNAYDSVLTVPATTAGFKYEITDEATAPYMGKDGKVKALFRVILPNRSGNQPSPFNLKLEQLQLKGEAAPTG
jgi:hypothetical protein